MKSIFLTVLLGVCFTVSGFSQNEEIPIKPIPDWVEKLDFSSTEDDETKGSSGVYYLLLDFQDNIQSQEDFVHYSYRIQNTQGLQNSSDIMIDFDPTYQKLYIHEVSVYRGSNKIDKLSETEIQTHKKEDEADRFLYNGTISAVIHLSDIRVGDVIDYSYSIKGYNPVYKGDYFSSYTLNSSFPYKELNLRILSDEKRKLNIETFNGAPDPRIVSNGSITEYRWSTENSKPEVFDQNVPGWYDPYPKISLSAFTSWEEVVQWALPYYSVNNAEMNALKSELSELEGSSEEELILNAIRFVQDDIRYLGFESGMSAYKPNDPSTVLKRRFGDCKDKSLLLASILQAHGIKSYPMLVNSEETKGIAGSTPSPIEFDHCVVALNFKGMDYYIDPTISNQGGKLENYYFPNYAKGLILKKGEKGLTDLPSPKESKVETKESFRISSIGKGATLEVETGFYGDKADYQREYFKSYSLDEITKGYVDFYSNIFPSISAVKNIEFIDEERDHTNKVIVKESYVIEEVWEPLPGDEETIYVEFFPMLLQSYLTTNSTGSRKTPLYIGEPTSYFHETLIYLPEEWTVEDTHTEINGSGFRYSSEVKARSSKLVEMNYEYHILDDTVPAEDVSAFIADQTTIENDLSYSITYNQGLAGFSVSWISITLIVISFILCLIVAHHFYFNVNPEPQTDPKYERNIGGWLVLFSIGLVFSPLRIIIELISDPVMFNHAIWKVLLDENNTMYNPELAFLIGFEIVYNVIAVVLAVLLLIMIIQKRTSAPYLAIFYMVVTLVVLIIDTFMASTLSDVSFTEAEMREYYDEIFRSFLYTAVWTPYFLMSKRVKETFVNKLETEEEESASLTPSTL